MKKSSKNHDLFFAEPPSTFIPLKGKIFAEYCIIYQINCCYSIKAISQINSRYQLLFQKFDNQTQQRNLVLIDGIFPILLADVAIQTLSGKISTLQEFVNQHRFFVAENPKTDKRYYTYKFRAFIQHLLFSNIASNKICKGDIDTTIVYYQKNDSSEIEYYSIFRQLDLQELLLKKMILEIDLNKSVIEKRKVTLAFRMCMV